MRKLFGVALAAALMCGCSNMKSKECCKEEGEEKDEVKMAMSDIPAAAHEGIMRESGGISVDKVDKETRDGKTVYEADVVMKDGKNWEIVVDGSGNKVSKKLDEESEEHEKKGKKEKEEDDEKDEKK